MLEKSSNLAAVGVKLPVYSEKSLMLHGFCKYGKCSVNKTSSKGRLGVKYSGSKTSVRINRREEKLNSKSL